MQSQTGCRPPNCFGPCDAPKSKVGSITPVASTKRGDKIDVTWPRNNHAAGFIRFSWAPTDDSDNPDAFNQNVQMYTCHEMTCKSSSPADPVGGDSDGQAPGTCKMSINVPSQLNDGNWTLQWSWFGGAFALSDYYSCIDYSVQGGDENTLEPLKPSFEGGDVHSNGSNSCMYFNTNDLGICKTEPCTTGNKPGKQTGAPLPFEQDSSLLSGTVSNVEKGQANESINLNETSPSDHSDIHLVSIPSLTVQPLTSIAEPQVSPSPSDTEYYDYYYDQDVSDLLVLQAAVRILEERLDRNATA